MKKGRMDLEQKNYSDDTARRIDSAVKALVEEAHGRARGILEQKRAALDALAALLQEKEVISGAQAEALLRSQA